MLVCCFFLFVFAGCRCWGLSLIVEFVVNIFRVEFVICGSGILRSMSGMMVLLVRPVVVSLVLSPESSDSECRICSLYPLDAHSVVLTLKTCDLIFSFGSRSSWLISPVP